MLGMLRAGDLDAVIVGTPRSLTLNPSGPARSPVMSSPFGGRLM